MSVIIPETTQYTNQPGYYSVPQELTIYYPSHLPTRESTGVYETRPQGYHLEQKPLEHYTLRSQSAHILHSTSIPLNPVRATAKAGGITGGYPVRNQTQYQPTPAPAAAIYTTQNGPHYRSPNTPVNYPRD